MAANVARRTFSKIRSTRYILSKINTSGFRLKCHCVLLYLDVSIRKSVPGPVSAIHAVCQTVARHPLVRIVPPLGRQFGHCSFPPEGNLQPLVAIVTLCAPSSCFSTSWDFVQAAKLRHVIGAVRCWCWYCSIGQMTTPHSQWKETTANCGMEKHDKKNV